MFLNRIRIVKEKVPAVEKKSPRLVLPFVGTISLQTRTKLQKSSKRVFTEVNYKLFSKVKINSNIICFKDLDPQIHTAGVVYKFQCGLCNENDRQSVGHFAVRIGEHVRISPLTNKMVQPRKDTTVFHHLLNCNYHPPLPKDIR